MTNPEDGAKHIVNEYYSNINSGGKEYLKEINIYNDQITDGTTIEKGELDYVYPQPYSYYKHSDISLAIPAQSSSTGKVNFYVYTISMNLVYSAQHEVNTGGKRMILWNGLDNNGNKLPSGIYIYVTETDNKTLKGKMAIVNE